LLCSAGAANAREGLIDEIRFGLYQHDTGLIGTQKEHGVDSELEILSHPLTSLSLIGSPRIVIGGVVNSAGQTDQAYIGLDAQWDFVHGVINPGDSFFVEGNVGGSWNDGKTDVVGTTLEQRWKSHGSHFLIRSGVDFGYKLNSVWSVAISFNHISNAGLASKNEGMNDLGLRVGMKL
jgi:lipid A 3-O-deacylase